MVKLVCLFVLAVIVHAGSAVKCYNCQSSAANDCTDYSKIPTIDCHSSRPRDQQFPPVCIRRVLKGPDGLNITLQCTEKQTGNECDSPSPIRYNVTDCKICQEDLCNDHSKNLANVNLVAVLMASVLCFIFMQF